MPSNLKFYPVSIGAYTIIGPKNGAVIRSVGFDATKAGDAASENPRVGVWVEETVNATTSVATMTLYAVRANRVTNIATMPDASLSRQWTFRGIVALAKNDVNMGVDFNGSISIFQDISL